MRPSAEPLLRFVIGGAQKGGTSALARYLDAHPALCLPTLSFNRMPVPAQQGQQPAAAN